MPARGRVRCASMEGDQHAAGLDDGENLRRLSSAMTSEFGVLGAFDIEAVADILRAVTPLTVMRLAP